MNKHALLFVQIKGKETIIFIHIYIRDILERLYIDRYEFRFYDISCFLF
jgi:hypothetical protein